MDDPTLVGDADLERELSFVRDTVSHSSHGLFGPGSLLWRVNRESVLFLGAGRALLLQLAHPWIAAAIADHSSVLKSPVERFHQTFSVVFSMQFGTAAQALAAARRLHRRHANIRGILAESAGPFPASTPYFANELEVLKWVYATLIDTALLAHDLVLPPLSEEEREGYYRENRRFAALFGLPQSSLPADWTAFLAYMRAMGQSDVLTVTGPARAIAGQIFADAGPWPRPPRWYRAITAHLLPPRLRDAFGMAYGEAQERTAKSALNWIRRLYPFLPHFLRNVGPYQEAQSRLSGKIRPNLIIQELNRFWIGRGELS